jgi:chromate transporter
MGEVFWTALKLGLTAFGGPIAHLGYFERTYVRKLAWLTSAEYAQVVALCQSLPGPTSSQVGFLVGMRKAGWQGALAAWVGFTLPSALLMYGFAAVVAALPPQAERDLLRPILHGLVLTAVAIVAQAVWSMARSLCPDWPRRVFAALSCLTLLLLARPAAQTGVMVLGAVAGLFFCRGASLSEIGLHSTVSPRTATASVSVYLLLLAAFSWLAAFAPHGPVALAAIFYRAGALVFGGGHVVLPLLRQELVPGGWLPDSSFLSGYALAQGLPGPLFTVAAYLGAASAPAHHAAAWSLLAVAAIFLPGLLLATSGVSLWNRLARVTGAGAALAGINASVVGILAAALYDPVWRSGVHDFTDAIVAVAAFVLLQLVRLPAAGTALICILVGLARQQFAL